MTRHRFDPFSFIAGAFAAALAVAVLVGQVTIDLLDLRIAGPLLLLVLGLSLLLGGGRDRPLQASEPSDPAEPSEPTEPTERAEPGDTDDADRATEEVTDRPQEADVPGDEEPGDAGRTDEAAEPGEPGDAGRTDEVDEPGDAGRTDDEASEA